MSTSLSPRPAAPVHPTRQQLDELDALLQRMLDLPVSPMDDEAADEATPAVRLRPAAKDRPPDAPPPHPARGLRPIAFRPADEPEANDEVEDAAPVNYQTPEAGDAADGEPRVADDKGNVADEGAPPAPGGIDPKAVESDPAAKEDWVPLPSTWRPSARTWKPLADTWRQARAGTGREPPAPPEPAPTPMAGDLLRESQPLAERAAHHDKPPPLPPPAAVPPPPPRAVEPPPPPAPVPLKAPAPVRRPAATPPTPTPRPRTPLLAWPLVAFNAAFDLFLAPWGPPGRWLRGAAGRRFLGALGLLCLAAAVALGLADWLGWTW